MSEPIENAPIQASQTTSPVRKVIVFIRTLFSKERLLRVWPLFPVLFLFGMFGGIWKAAPRPQLGPPPGIALQQESEAALVPELGQVASTNATRFDGQLRQAIQAGTGDDTLAPVASGNLVRPCPGRVSMAFGWRRDDALGTWRLQAGVFLEAPAESHVVAIAPGRVARVEQDSQHGTVVAIDHDSHWRALYGNLGPVTVSAGDRVTAGQIIASVGPGPEGGFGLYFALYRDGEPQDPQTVIPGL